MLLVCTHCEAVVELPSFPTIVDEDMEEGHGVEITVHAQACPICHAYAYRVAGLDDVVMPEEDEEGV